MKASPKVSSVFLRSLGWDADLESALAPHGARDGGGVVPGRLTRVDRTACDVLTADGPVRATVSTGILAAAAEDPTATPCVGDWAALRHHADCRTTVERVLPRRTVIVRTGVAPGTSHGQVLAANVDLAVVVEPLRPEPDLGRIERLLALAWTSGAQPMVVLTKADLVPDADVMRAEVAAASPGVDVHPVSAVSGTGLEGIRMLLAPGRTLALLGPSGGGKSSLTNALAGESVMPTRGLRADGKGRHTTAHRELVVLPGGGLVIDTPGLRSVGLTGAEGGLDRAFADVEELAMSCRFTDCGHHAEPGCAVTAAVRAGELSERRHASWQKLQREARWMARRQDARLRAAERARWRSISLELRRSGISRP